jgi:hypothetical protein
VRAEIHVLLERLRIVRAGVRWAHCPTRSVRVVVRSPSRSPVRARETHTRTTTACTAGSRRSRDRGVPNGSSVSELSDDIPPPGTRRPPQRLSDRRAYDVGLWPGRSRNLASPFVVFRRQIYVV